MMTAAYFKNTARTYGLIAIAFHWIVAVAFLANYALIYCREWFIEPGNERARSLLSTHFAVGVSVLVFVVLRIIWRWMSTKPEEIEAPPLQRRAAHWAHIFLYTAIVVTPLTGYLGTGGPSKLFFWIDLPAFKNTTLFQTVVESWMGLSWDAFEKPIDVIHKQGGTYVVSAVIALHIFAALYHHFIVKDVTLKRMLSPHLVKS